MREPNLSHFIRYRSLLLAASVVAVGLLAGCGSDDPSGFIGKPAPEMVLAPLTKGGNIKLSDYRGKVVLLDFWATWCGPCRMLMPHVSLLNERYSSKGLVVLGVTSEEKETVTDFRNGNPDIKYDFVLDPGSEASRAIRATGLPTTVIVGKDGTIQYYDVGYSDDIAAKLDKKVAELLNG